jgi:TolA-binding protein
MRTRMRLFWATLLASCIAAGCTIAEIKSDNARREQQVRVKEQELQQAQQTQSDLQAEKQRLLDDLRTRELSIGELKGRLDQLQRLNAASAASTQQQLQQKNARQKQLSDAASQVKAAEQDTTSTPDAKAKRLNAVRQQLRQTLELLSVT